MRSGPMSVIKKGENMDIYIVGTTWFSGDQGSLPNVSDLPSYVETSLSAATQKYEELAKKDSTDAFGF